MAQTINDSASPVISPARGAMAEATSALARARLDLAAAETAHALARRSSNDAAAALQAVVEAEQVAGGQQAENIKAMVAAGGALEARQPDSGSGVARAAAVAAVNSTRVALDMLSDEARAALSAVEIAEKGVRAATRDVLVEIAGQIAAEADRAVAVLERAHFTLAAIESAGGTFGPGGFERFPMPRGAMPHLHWQHRPPQRTVNAVQAWAAKWGAYRAALAEDPTLLPSGGDL